MTEQQAIPKLPGVGAEEWQLRVQLAACYRIFDHLGWTELIFNHITVKVPGPEKHFLINPYGLWYREVTASNLVKIDLAGNVIGKSDWPVNPAGFIIHSAIHGARADAQCVMHTHTTAGMAVACQAGGLRPANFYAAPIYSELAYHEFEGITTDPDEKPRLLASIGARNVVILRNHGLLTIGGSIPEAFMRLWSLQRACEVQVAAQSGGGPLLEFPPELCDRAARQVAGFEKMVKPGEKPFAALVRRIDAIDPGYRS